jgi:hypothetical protein
MIGLSSLLLISGLLVLQEPGVALQRALDAVEPSTRREAAVRLADIGLGVNKWLAKNAGNGSANRQRSLLLAAALLGSPDSLAILEEAARRGRKPHSTRAYALLLYGAYHPDAGKEPKKDWARASSEFERACLLAGYLAHQNRVNVADLNKVVGKRLSPRLAAMLGLLRSLEGAAPELAGDSSFERSARLLASVMSGQGPVEAELPLELAADLPEMWRISAQRTPGRSFRHLQGQPLGGDSGVVVFALRELSIGQRQAGFDFLKTRIVDEPPARWLWGLAGDLQLDLSLPLNAELRSCEVAGFLRLALMDFEAAQVACQRRLVAARLVLANRSDFPRQIFHAALVLALAGQAEDFAWFKTELAQGTPEFRSRLQPMWLLASRKLGVGPARNRWISLWSRELGASNLGYLDREGPRWTALSLISGTMAGPDRTEIAAFEKPFQVELDHPLTDEFYADLAEYFLSGLYRWSLE